MYAFDELFQFRIFIECRRIAECCKLAEEFAGEYVDPCHVFADKPTGAAIFEILLEDRQCRVEMRCLSPCTLRPHRPAPFQREP